MLAQNAIAVQQMQRECCPGFYLLPVALTGSCVLYFKCRTRPQAFCEDCLPPGDIDAVGDVLLEFQLLGYSQSGSAHYNRCHTCREEYDSGESNGLSLAGVEGRDSQGRDQICSDSRPEIGSFHFLGSPYDLRIFFCPHPICFIIPLSS